MWWRMAAIVVLGFFSTVGGRSFLSRIQHLARQFQHVPTMVQDICVAVDQHAQLLEQTLSIPVSNLSREEKQRRAQVGSQQGWACAKCRGQLDDAFQVLNIRRRDMAICSSCIHRSLSGQC